MLRFLLLVYLVLFPARFFASLMNKAWYRESLRHWALSLGPIKTESALEVGSGPGLLSRFLGERAGSVLGVDNSTHMTTYAQRKSSRSGVAFVNADVFEPNFTKGQSFDLILGASLLNTVQNKAALVSNCIEHLRRSGRLSFLFPTPSMSASRAMRYASAHKIRGFSRAFLLSWAGMAPKLSPQSALGLFDVHGKGQIAMSEYLDGMVAAITFTKGTNS